MNKNTFKLNYITALFVVLLFVLSNFFPLIISIFDKSFLNDKTQLDYLLIIQSLPYAITFLGIYFLFNQNNSDLRLQNKLFSLPVFSCSIALFFFTLMLNEYLIGFVPTKGNEFLEKLYKELSSTFNLLKAYPAAMVFATCVFAPIFEEILFRGIILKGLLNNRKKPIFAIIFTSLLFGLVHGNPWQFIGAFTLGIIM
ncbi:MAG: lysostaphin resistance A-like protein, partial [Solirubrobacteraceae bacterium]